MSNWRTVQVFLSPRHPAIYEVELDVMTADIRCSCPTFRAKEHCRHSRIVEKRMEDAGGQYPILLEDSIEESTLSASLSDPSKFRNVIYRFGRVEVL